jgi:SAM-dependent methyltransferase
MPDEVEPRHALANKLRSALWGLVAQRTQIGLGRTLSRRSRIAGLTDVNREVTFNLGGQDARRMQHTLIAAATGAGRGRLGERARDRSAPRRPRVDGPRHRGLLNRFRMGPQTAENGYAMDPRALRFLYEALSRIGLNPSLNAADVPDTWLVQYVEGPDRLAPGRVLDLGCGAGRNTRYFASHRWDAVGIDMLGRAIDKARCQAVGAAAKARFLQGDVTRLGDLDIGDGFSLIVDSGCYYGLSGDQREGYAAGVTRVAAPGAVLVMAGFTKIPGIVGGIAEDDLRNRFGHWELRTSAPVPIGDLMRHTRIPFPLKAALRTGRLHVHRFELTKRA